MRFPLPRITLVTSVPLLSSLPSATIHPHPAGLRSRGTSPVLASAKLGKPTSPDIFTLISSLWFQVVQGGLTISPELWREGQGKELGDTNPLSPHQVILVPTNCFCACVTPSLIPSFTNIHEAHSRSGVRPGTRVTEVNKPVLPAHKVLAD